MLKKVKPEVVVEPELVQLEVVIEKPKEELEVLGGHKFRKVIVNHSCGDVTTQLELVE